MTLRRNYAENININELMPNRAAPNPLAEDYEILL
jgi:hypothetical protein